MAEGIAIRGKVTGTGVHDDPDSKPAPSAEAPKDWTWHRTKKTWVPRVRGPVLWQPGSDPKAEAADVNARAGITPEKPERGMGILGRLHAKPADPEPDAQPSADNAQPENEGRDPDPGWMDDRDRKIVPIRTWQGVDKETRADIRALIALGYTIPGETLPLLDPYCFGPLADDQTAVGVIDAVTDIVCGSPRIAAWAASAAGLMPWIQLGKALQPVAVAAFRHHIVKTVEVEIDREAREMVVTKRDYSQYTAA